jgi:pimeloyl-ACP methyl ester carboxylesterase
MHLLLVAACNNSDPKALVQPDDKFKEGFVESDKVKLQYLDWGGDGQVLILICGLGDTPYLFENLAQELSNEFRVIAYSRRDHSQSRSSDKKYDNATLVSDLKLLLDSLKINKANLLGWSMGGNEITEFASLYPDRVGKLIYFESGYDLSDGGFANLLGNIPKSFLPDTSVMSSLNNYREWYHHFWFGDVEWNNSLEANLQASVRVKSDGGVEMIPTDEVFRSTLREAMKYRRSYERVEAPSLVIYTKPFLHPADNDSATVALYDSLENNIVNPWRSRNKMRVERELRNASLVEAPNGSHTSLLFLSHDFLVKTINSFLKEKG